MGSGAHDRSVRAVPEGEKNIAPSGLTGDISDESGGDERGETERDQRRDCHKRSYKVAVTGKQTAGEQGAVNGESHRNGVTAEIAYACRSSRIGQIVEAQGKQRRRRSGNG